MVTNIIRVVMIRNQLNLNYNHHVQNNFYQAWCKVFGKVVLIYGNNEIVNLTIQLNAIFVNNYF